MAWYSMDMEQRAKDKAEQAKQAAKKKEEDENKDEPSLGSKITSGLKKLRKPD